MAGIEWKRITPEELVREIEEAGRLNRENKYAFQVGIKDLDFDINEELLKTLGKSIPFKTISESEQSLTYGAIVPAKFIEFDDTEHIVLAFDPRPVGFSGFMDCVTHSLALTNQGLFEVGRYPAVNLSSPGRSWQWFLHRRLANAEDVDNYLESHNCTSEQFLDEVHRSMIIG
jgi:hypothetical protein